jgi:hypothetical protein
VDQRSEAAVAWLLASREPAIRLMASRDILGERMAEDTDEVLSGAKVSALLSGQRSDGGFGGHPYRKWTGAYWRLISLAELAIPAHEPRGVAALDLVLTWRHRARQYVSMIDGLARICASIDGNVLAVCCKLGLASDPRTYRIVESLISWQWPDGGWNCDRKASGRRSSFHESLATAWGLFAYSQATGDPDAEEAANRAAELFLEHRLFRRLRTGEVIDRTWLVPHYPPYWRYDILQGLLVLARMGKARDPRASDAVDELEHQRLPDGRWKVSRCWWNPPTSSITPDVVDWGRSGPNEMITLNALRVLRAAGRLAR